MVIVYTPSVQRPATARNSFSPRFSPTEETVPRSRVSTKENSKKLVMKTASGVKNPALMVEGHTERDREALQSCRERRGGVPKVTGTGRGLGK